MAHREKQLPMSNCRPPSGRAPAVFFFVCIFLALGSHPANGKPQSALPPKGTCSPTDYKILTPFAVAIKCDMSPSKIPDASGELVLVAKNGQATRITSAVQVATPKRDSGNQYPGDWLVLYWPSSDQTNLTPGKRYIFNLLYKADSSVAGNALDNIPPLTIPIDTTETVTLSSPQLSEPLEFLATSHVAFVTDSNTLAYSPKPKTDPDSWPSCAVNLKIKLGLSSTLNAQCSELTPAFAGTPNLTN